MSVSTTLVNVVGTVIATGTVGALLRYLACSAEETRGYACHNE
jgi:hypothetical protein